MKIYNTLTRKKETFKPLAAGRVGMYVCGPTVYDLPHIGHARAAYIFEVARSYFEYKKYKVKFVKNITDIDDKIIEKAKGELPDVAVAEAVGEIAVKYTKSYYQAMDALGIRRATVAPRATEHIKKMQEYIKRLIKKKFAYSAGGNVYFDVRKFRDYGRLSHQNPDEMRSGTKSEGGKGKKNALDFALWKKAKEGEPFWESPWGNGRPGWHIECSVMANIYLGEEFDIHAGGGDLIFPHHENEIAQSRAFSGKKSFARVWMHNGLLTINGRKMAKSLGNFISVTDFLNKGYTSDVLKLFFLQTHYSQPIDFSWEKMEEKRESLDRIAVFLERVKQKIADSPTHRAPHPSRPLKKAVSPQKLRKEIKDALKDFEKCMEDDFNTPNAMVALFEIVRSCNRVLYDDSSTGKYLPVLKYAAKTIKKLSSVLGVSFQEGPLPVSKKEIEGLIKLRESFRKKKMFKESDQFRKELEEKGIVLEDTKEGTIWRKKV
jgi:cysteinyl-tRNA synthetase